MSGAKAAAPVDVDPEAVAAAASVRATVAGPAGALPAADSGEARASLKKPLYWAGKLFYRASDGDYVCSAQFVSPTVVMTTASCVRNGDTGAWYDNFVFALGYDRGRYIDVFYEDCVGTKNGWVQKVPDRYVYDYALIKVTKRSPTGHFGTQWNWAGEYRDGARVGYVKGKNNGESPTVDTGRLAVAKGIVGFRHGSRADQAGISGAAFIGAFSQAEKSNEGNYVLSVDSFSFRDEPGTNYGPYLDSSFKDLFDYVERGCR
ncbi:MAG: hypothetical protein KDK07_07390 [Bauldia sp.]|nr:hypothetical protein [Bauldia sp.]